MFISLLEYLIDTMINGKKIFNIYNSDIFYKNTVKLLFDISNFLGNNRLYNQILLFKIKEFLHSEVDNTEFKNPITVSMRGLNDVWCSQLNNHNLSSLILLLQDENHDHLIGLYIRWIKKFLLRQNKSDNNLQIILNIAIRKNWLPSYLLNIIQIINALDHKNFHNLIKCVLLCLERRVCSNYNIQNDREVQTIYRSIIFENVMKFEIPS